MPVQAFKNLRADVKELGQQLSGMQQQLGQHAITLGQHAIALANQTEEHHALRSMLDKQRARGMLATLQDTVRLNKKNKLP